MISRLMKCMKYEYKISDTLKLYLYEFPELGGWYCRNYFNLMKEIQVSGKLKTQRETPIIKLYAII